jgi:hypothetical protein
VRAQLIIELVTSERLPSGQRPRALRLYGARITGRLDLEALTLACPLVLCGCYFEPPVKLDEARALSVRLSGCHIPYLSARLLETRGDLALDGLRANKVDLAGAHIGGSLSLRGAKLRSRSGQALDADGLRVDLDMVCDTWNPPHGRDEQFCAEGKVLLPRAHIGGKLNFDGATLSNSSGEALRADRLRFVLGMFCREGFSAEGEVRLTRAHIDGQLSFKGAKLRGAALRNGRGRRALYATGLRVDQDVSFEPSERRGRRRRFCAEGELVLDRRAHRRAARLFRREAHQLGWAGAQR